MGLNKTKPQKRSRYHQGYINPRSCKKYMSPNMDDPIVYRSGLEYRFCLFCESSAQIASWSSEPVAIPYMSQLDNKVHTYYPDYVVVSNTGEKALIEIKPEAQTRKPKDTASLYDKEQWLKNVSKWKYAMEWCLKHDYKFMIVTENFFAKTK